MGVWLLVLFVCLGDIQILLELKYLSFLGVETLLDWLAVFEI